MIAINLLPEERRPVERTPLPRFLTILGGVLGFCIEGLILVFVLTDYRPQENILEEALTNIQRYEVTIKQIDNYRKEIAGFDTREGEILKLYRDRRAWAPILNRLSDPEVLPQNVWYSKVVLRQGRASGPRTKPRQELTISGHARGPEDNEAPMYQAVGEFASNLMIKHEGFSEVFEGKPQYPKPVEVATLPGDKDDPTVPSRALDFTLTLMVKAKKPVRATH